MFPRFMWMFLLAFVSVLGLDLPPLPGQGFNLPDSGPGLPPPPPPPLPPDVGPPETTKRPGRQTGGIGVDVGHFNCNTSIVETCKHSAAQRRRDGACFCDEFCRVMNDCCDDYDRKIYTKLVDRRREVRQKLQCSGTNEDGREVEHYPSGYLMMKTCPDAYPRNMIKYMCETGDKRDTFRLWPVSSKTTGIFYKNIYCSLCWEDPDVLYWIVELRCIKKEEEKETFKNKMMELAKIADLKGMKECVNPDEKDINPLMCRRLTGFLNPFDCKSKMNLRPCDVKYISTCDATWRNVNVEEECIRQTSRVMVKSDNMTIYKNHHCGICNYVHKDELECVATFSGIATVRRSFGRLFDLEIGCEKNEVYDVFAQRCRPLYCYKGQIHETDRCSWVDTNRTMNCDLVELKQKEYTLYNNGTLLLHKANLYVNESSFDIHNDTVFVCSDVLATMKEDLITSQGLVTVICLSISICCLFLLFMVYLVLPKLRNVPGKILMSLTFALFWAQILFLVGIDRTEIPEMCIAFAMLIHYFFLAAFAWMTMLATDMALTFRPMNLHGGSKKNRFLYVSLYAWSLPAVIVVPGIVMDQYEVIVDPFNPGYGQNGNVCWFSNRMALIIFFLVPSAAHLLVNFICYVYTVYNIAVVSKLAKKAKQCDKCNLFLYFKLSLIMGGTWFMAYIWVITRNDVVEYAFTIMNGLQGLFLFLAFVCRKRTWHQLKRREMITTTSASSKSTQDTNMSLMRYRNASYKFKYDRPGTSIAVSEGERQKFI